MLKKIIKKITEKQYEREIRQWERLIEEMRARIYNLRQQNKYLLANEENLKQQLHWLQQSSVKQTTKHNKY